MRVCLEQVPHPLSTQILSNLRYAPNLSVFWEEAVLGIDSIHREDKCWCLTWLSCSQMQDVSLQA